MVMLGFTVLLTLCSMVEPRSHHQHNHQHTESPYIIVEDTESPYIIGEDTTEIQEDSTEIHEDSTEIHEGSTEIQEGSTETHEGSTEIHEDTTEIYKDTTEIHEDTTDATSEESQEKPVLACDEVMANNGLNFSSFWHGAAHGIHSIYLEEIREFFEPDAPAINRIPVVNQNLSAEQIILFDAPMAGYDEDFGTMSMKVMAYFMLNDGPDFATQGINTLEKITHQYHMHELYAAAAPIYKRMKENPPKDAELCPCVNDITGNGILEEVVNIARQLKYFNTKRQPRQGKAALEAGCRPRPPTRGTYFSKYYTRIKSCRRKRSADTVTPAMIAQYQQEYLANSNHETAGRLLDATPWTMNSLVGPEQWISYEAMLTLSMLQEKELNDFTVFMYCKLNQPTLDHQKGLFTDAYRE